MRIHQGIIMIRLDHDTSGEMSQNEELTIRPGSAQRLVVIRDIRRQLSLNSVMNRRSDNPLKFRVLGNEHIILMRLNLRTTGSDDRPTHDHGPQLEDLLEFPYIRGRQATSSCRVAVTSGNCAVCIDART